MGAAVAVAAAAIVNQSLSKVKDSLNHFVTTTTTTTSAKGADILIIY